MSTPSAGGLRFVPALALVALLIRIDHLLQNVNHYVYFGHLGWSLAALWSPESGFYATCVWWPYFLLLRTSKSNNHRDFLVNLYKALAALLLVAFVLVALFATAFWLVYRTPPSGSAFFAYALNPPGQLSIDANGAIWFFIAFVILASLHNWQMFRQAGNTMLFRRGLILLLFTYSTFSYFVGRSHDNNILNIVPFMLLVLLHIFSTAVDRSLRMIAATLLAALLGWSSSFGWDAWFLPSGKLNDIEFNSSWISAVIFDAKAHQLRTVHAPFSDDAARALSETQRDTQEAVTVVSSWNGLASTNAEAVWSAFHGPANIVLFPSAMRRRFLSHTAGTLKRSGWLIFPQSELRGALIADFDSVYSRKEVRDFGTVLAIRYAPK